MGWLEHWLADCWFDYSLGDIQFHDNSKEECGERNFALGVNCSINCSLFLFEFLKWDFMDLSSKQSFQHFFAFFEWQLNEFLLFDWYNSHFDLKIYCDFSYLLPLLAINYFKVVDNWCLTYSLSIFISDLKWFSFWFFSREFCSVFPIIPLLIFSLSKESNCLNGI